MSEAPDEATASLDNASRPGAQGPPRPSNILTLATEHDDDDLSDFQPDNRSEGESSSDFRDAEEALLDHYEMAVDVDQLAQEVDGDGHEDNAALTVADIDDENVIQLFGGYSALGRLLVQHLNRNNRNARTGDDDDEVEVAGEGREDEEEEEEEEEEGELGDEDLYHIAYGGRRRTRRTSPPEFPKIPNEAGTELMNSGLFGRTDPRPNKMTKRKSALGNRLLQRELGIVDDGNGGPATRMMVQGMLPSSRADMIIHYDSKCYSGQFSDDGNFFFSCAQDFKVRMYDTSNPHDWKYYKTVDYPLGQWTITDASLSPDNKFLAYSSIKPIVCLAPTDPTQDEDPWTLDFSYTGSHRGASQLRSSISFGIWSLRFSGDGKEIVAGASDSSVYVYNIETRQSILRIPGHEEDVNAVCFGDNSSPHILYSGSDDSTIKVWDRRSMGDRREAGVFLGHVEGVTYVDSKGDGRYVLSNGKDQTMKLWDLRKMWSAEEAKGFKPRKYCGFWDYRWGDYDYSDWKPHPHDCSVVTFRGHQVVQTLIRCHFSPPMSTDSRYVYSGSHDGSVYIYNMDGTVAKKVDVRSATCESRKRNRPIRGLSMHHYGLGGNERSWDTCVRDVSWHPNAPIIAATAWNGWGMSTGTCSTHSWNDGQDDDDEDRNDKAAVPKLKKAVNSILQPMYA